MSDFTVNILGCGSATPTLRHQPSSQVVNFRERLLMVDCGEGAQLQMRRMRLKFARLGHVFISHTHGDHLLGLPGLLSTMALHDKEGGITVHAFPDAIKLLRTIMDTLCRDRPFDLTFNEIDPAGGQIVLDEHNLTVETIKLYHRVPCVGYIFRSKPGLRHLDAEMADFFNVPVSQYIAIKQGADFVAPDGRVIANERLTRPGTPGVSYAYCSDTMFDPRVAEAVQGVDVLYHEATYGDDSAYKAAPRGHSTARQAGIIAREAGVGKLIIGHYSKQYNSEDQLLTEAREEFPCTVAATEGLTVDVTPKPKC